MCRSPAPPRVDIEVHFVVVVELAEFVDVDVAEVEIGLDEVDTGVSGGEIDEADFVVTMFCVTVFDFVELEIVV